MPARRRAYQFERLEDRLAMDGDASQVVDLVTEDDLTAATAIDQHTLPPTTAGMPVEALPEYFQSAEELEAWLIEAAIAEWGHYFGRSAYNPYWFDSIWPGDIQIMPFVVRADVSNFDSLSGNAIVLNSSVASTTNVQVEGVDEADLVETDGEYLYILSGNDLVIVQAGIGVDLRVLSRVRLEGRPVGMYLDGDRLAIVSTSGQPSFQITRPAWLFAPRNDESEAQQSSRPTTTVTLLDIADRSAPTLVQKSQMDGELVASRVVDGQLRLVLSNSLHLPPPIALPIEGEIDESPEAIYHNPMRLAPIDGSIAVTTIDSFFWYPTTTQHYRYETQDEYLARVKDELLKSAMPGVRILGLDGEVKAERPLVDVSDILRPESLRDKHLTTVATFDLSGNEAGPIDATAVLTESPVQVYASVDSLYLFSEHWRPGSTYHVGPRTSIYKFDFDAETHAVTLAARGEVVGTLLNQFAADEFEGHLRVVAGNSFWDNGGQSVFVLKQVGNRLEIVGSVDGIAPNEQIYSVRFMGERAFLVTFRMVDPLFALDLSDPTDPRVLGELKIPGYSDYLQPLDENHLLAIGRGADEGTGLFQELQVSIFNIADLTDPQLVHRYSFEGGRSIATPATGDRWQRGDGDHHAVSYFADAGVFALPIYHTGDWPLWWNWDVTASTLEAGQGGLQVFQIDVTAGFTPIGLIQHETLVERSVRIGEHLFAISSGKITVHELTDPTVELGSLQIDVESESTLTLLSPFTVPIFEIRLQSLPAELPVADSESRLELALPPLPRAALSTPGSRTVLIPTQEAFSAIDELLLVSRHHGTWVGQAKSESREPLDEAFADADESEICKSAFGLGLAAKPGEPLVPSLTR